MDHTTRDLLATWTTLLGAEFALALWVAPDFPIAKLLAELVGVGVLAASHVVLAKQDWMRSVLWPPLLFVGVYCLAAGGLSPKVMILASLPIIGLLWWLQGRPAVRRYGLGIGIILSLLAVPTGRALFLTQSLEGRVAWGSAPGGVQALIAEVTPRPPLPPVTHTGPTLVVISIDTLRWQQMAEMASVKRLASRGVYWQQALSTSSWTVPAVASLQTGLMPSEHGATAQIGGSYQGLAEDVPTLAERLSQAGYRTLAITTNAWLTPTMGFARGFQRYELASLHTPQRLMLAGFSTNEPADRANRTTDLALAAVADLPDRGGYLWVHYVDPHMPYNEGETPDWIAGRGEIPARLASEDDRAGALASYEVQVDYLDQELLRLLDGIEMRGWDNDPLVVITADHGEEFWEHGGLGHGHAHHGEVTDVGLVVSGPGFTPGTTGAGQASLMDVPTTLLQAANLPTDDLQGLDLAALPADRVVTAWGNFKLDIQASARDDQWRVILDSHCRMWAYDRHADPDEQHPRWIDPSHPVVQAVLAQTGPLIQSGGSDVSQQLAALGYVVGEADGSDGWPTCAPEDLQQIGEQVAPIVQADSVEAVP